MLTITHFKKTITQKLLRFRTRRSGTSAPSVEKRRKLIEARLEAETEW